MILVGAAVFAAALVYGFGTADPQAPRWVVVHALAAVLAARWAWGAFRFGEVRIPPVFWWSLPLLAWAGASLIWSADPMEGLHQIKDGAALWIVMLWASTRDDWWRLAPFAVLAMVLLILLDTTLPTEVYGGLGNQNFAAEYVLATVPFALFLGWRGAPIVVLAVWYILFWNGALVEAAAGGMVALALVWRLPHRWLSIAGLAGAAAAAVALMPHARDSLITRSELWWNTLQAWLAAPLAGHGQGAFNYVYPMFQEAHRWFLDDTFIGGTDYAGHAHNEVLHIGSELGLVGVVALGFLVWRLLRSDGPPAARWSVIVLIGLSLIEFPLRNASTGLLGAVAVGLLASGDAMRVRLHWPMRAPVGAAAATLAVAVMIAGGLSFKAERAFAQTYVAIKSRPLHALKSNLQAYETYPLDRQYRHQIALTFVVLLNRRGDQVKVTTEAADRIHGIALSAGPATAVMLARLEYLYNTGQRDNPEARQILNYLKGRASLHAGTHKAIQAFSEK